MKYGMNLLLWTDCLGESILPVLEMLKEMGYDGVEVPMFNLDPDFYAAWGKRLDSFGLERTVVTVRGPEENCISSDSAIRTAGVNANKLAIDCCKALGAGLLAGPYHSALGEFSGAGPTEDEWNWGVESMQVVSEHAQANDVTLALEPLNRFECYLINSAEDAVKFVEAVDNPICQILYDTFHSNIEEKNISEAICTCAKHTGHVHISENDRSTPGQGNVRWAETFDTISETGYDGWMTVEAFGMAMPQLAAATKIWRKLFQSEEQLSRDALNFMKSEVEKRA